jgi:hypothetical protein
MLSAAFALLAVVGLAPASSGAAPSAQAGPAKVDIVLVAGCLRERGSGNWMLVGATAPTPSNANAPTKGEIPTAHVNGTLEFRLIGVSEFDLPKLRGQTVAVKALLIRATPVSRLNITSVAPALPNCAPGDAK